MSAYYCCRTSFEGVDEDAPAGTGVGTVLVCKPAILLYKYCLVYMVHYHITIKQIVEFAITLHMHAHAHAHTHTHTHTHTHNLYAQTYMHTYAHTHMPTHTRTHTHKHTHTHIHTHMHTHIRLHRQQMLILAVLVL